MHEETKLAEAKFFYNKMSTYQMKSTEFRYMLSAFLSAARSVTQYAFEEMKQIPTRKSWYEAYIPAHPPLGFFKDKRDINIHEKPIGLNIKLTITDSIGLSASVTVIHRDKEGNILNQETVKDAPTVNEPKPKTTPQVQFFFDNWTGNEDILALSQKYLFELEKFVHEAKSKGYIT